MPTKTSQTGSESTDATAGGTKAPARRSDGRVRRQAAGHRGVADEGEQDRRVPGRGYVVEASVGHIRDLPRNAADVPGRAQGRRLGAARRRRRQLLRAALRGQPRPQAAGQPAQAAGEGRQRGLPRDRRGPRGRGDRLAPGRHPQAPRPRAPDGLPRDHPRGDRPRRRQPARARHRPGRRPGDPPHPRPPLRLRGLARCSGRRCCRSCRPAGCSPSPPASSWSASGSGWRSTPPTTGRSRAPSPSRAPAPRPTRASRRRSAPSWSASTTAGSPPARTSTRPPAGSSGDVVHLDEAGARGLAARLEGRQVERQPGRREALPAPSLRAVHHLHAADGRRPQARLVLGADDAGGAAAVRERPHHLHAYRLDEPVAGGDQRRPAAGPRAVRRRLRPGRGAPLQEQGQGRAGGARGDPPGR